MNCLDFRRLIGADPNSGDAEAAAHARTCAACADFAERTRALDRRILQALEIRVPSAPATDKFLLEPADEARERRRFPLTGKHRWLAVAASVVIGVGLAFTMWLLFPRGALAGDLVAHMAHEPHAWETAGAQVSSDQLDAVLQRSDMRTNIELGQVSYAQSCWFRGHFVPHLVVQDSGEPVTVLLLPEESVMSEQTFEEAGYRGLIVPVAQGSIAVLTRDRDLARARAAAERVRKVLQ